MFQTKLVLLIVAAFASANAFEIDPRIVQGQNATRGQFPFYVFLKVQMPQGTGACGGSLISDQYVVTAAHCLKGAKGAEVHLGALKAADVNEEGRVIVKVPSQNLHVHPKFFPLLVLNDIGLIKLPEPIKFSETIKPVQLACSSKNALKVVAIGNGLMDTHATSIAPTLQYTPLKTISKLECATDIPIIAFRKSVICVRGTQQRSVCRGDSGGPLVSAKSQALVGLTSFGNVQGCNLGFPQAFTRIASYLEWIKEVTGVSDCQNEI